VSDLKWVTFTRRTEDPKLGYLERRLDAMGIQHRRNGHSFHAPIMEVPEPDFEKACTLLDEWHDTDRCTTERLDDIPDDDSMFEES
jgi:hypothetical protein